MQFIKKALITSAFFVAWLPLALPAGAARTGDVARVIDGDSLQLKSGQQVRLVGVNTPEMKGADGQPEPLAETARTTLKRMIAGKPVRLIVGYEKFDRHRRLLAYVETADGRDVQERLLTEGLGFLVAVPPNLARLNRYRNAEDHARRAGRGVWGLDYYRPLNARDINSRDGIRGFRQVLGTVQKYNASKHNHYFRMSSGFEIKVPKINWLYFDDKPEDWPGKTLLVRGWVTQGKYRLQMRVAHPAMVDFQ